MMMVLDTRFGALLDPEYSDLYAKVASQLTQEYLELRARLAKHMGSNVDWLVSSAAIRDNFNSPLFHNCIIVKLLVVRHQSHQSLPQVIVDSNELGSVLTQLYRDLSCVPDVIVQTQSFSERLKGIKRILSPAGVILRQLRTWLSVKRHAGIRGLPCPSSGEPIKLIDTFVVSTAVEEDRYYAGLFDRLNPDQLRETYSVPTFHNLSISETSEAVKRIRAGSRNFLFKETYLRLPDILWACAHFLRVRNLQIPSLDWCGVDISPIWLMELKRRDHLQSAIIGLLNFRFFQSLRRANVIVSQTIDWFENQALDVGWNLGAHTYFPAAKTIGYQGFFQANHGASPTSYEYHLGVVPRRLCVMGPGLVKQRAQFCAEIEVEIAPAFRFGWLWEKEEQNSERRRVGSQNPPILMAVLPADQLTANYLLMLVTAISEQYGNWQFWVKPHPALPSSQLDKWLTRSARVAPVSGSLRELLRFQPIVLSGGMTTAGLEALAFGLPSIFCSPPGYQNQLPVPDVLRTASLLTCASVETLKLRIEEIEVRLAADKRYFQKSAATVREELFAPVTSSSMASLGFVN